MAKLLSAAFVWERLPARRAETSKGSFGHVLLAAGSRAYRGAPLLCAEGAARVGTGLVTLASLEQILNAAVVRLPECCLFPCHEAEGGIAADEAVRLAEKANAGTALAAGPGLGDTANTRALVPALVRAAKVPTVLDADALNVLAKLPVLPHPAGGAPLILTPHPGEMARLTGLSVPEIQAVRAETAARYAAAQNCVLVLKGSHTVIAAPDGTVYENPTGNPGLACGGSGDVLTGMIAGLLAQGLTAVDAACCGVWLHGAAADLSAKRLGQYGMLPHDIFSDLGRLFAESGR
ncbi:MAG: NAD(P)H-hydrate dehydratase [Faecalibacterium sp.]|jgi:NAD(P)H-hydrate epimerase|nr:NAD(P)H-hydrate dehydratase [Faecalibacterium sp.]